jgi:hypothetical protein
VTAVSSIELNMPVCWSGLVEAACQAAIKENRLAEGASRARPTVGVVEVTPPRLLFFEMLARLRFLFFENLAGAGANRWIGAEQRQTCVRGQPPILVLGKRISCRTISLKLNTRGRALDARGHDPVGMAVQVLAVRPNVHALHRRTKGVARVDHRAAKALEEVHVCLAVM